MKRLLFIGYLLHRKTHSADFMINLLKQQYEVNCIFVDYMESVESVREKIPFPVYDTVIIWEMPIQMDLSKFLKFRKGIFFPMYDYIPKIRELYHFRNFTFICFCHAAQRYLDRWGFYTIYVRYGPEPVQGEIPPGDEHSLFFWKRREFPSESEVLQLHHSYHLKHLYIHDVPDYVQGSVNMRLLQEIPNVERGQWFDNKNDMLQKMTDSALYFAPRTSEGIGMSFLEAMAYSRCVIAPDNPTMNEYIIHGKTGILYDPEKPVFSFSEMDVRRIQKNVRDYMISLYHEWQISQNLIFSEIKEENKYWCIKSILKRIRLEYKYFLSCLFPFAVNRVLKKICPEYVYNTIRKKYRQIN